MAIKMLYYRGEGYGQMAGIKEYVVLVEASFQDQGEGLSDLVEGNQCGGFEFVRAYDVDGDMPDELPMETTLVPVP
jgi:hypothetical protein